MAPYHSEIETKQEYIQCDPKIVYHEILVNNNTDIFCCTLLMDSSLSFSSPVTITQYNFIFTLSMQYFWCDKHDAFSLEYLFNSDFHSARLPPTSVLCRTQTKENDLRNEWLIDIFSRYTLKEYTKEYNWKRKMRINEVERIANQSNINSVVKFKFLGFCTDQYRVYFCVGFSHTLWENRFCISHTE